MGCSSEEPCFRFKTVSLVNDMPSVRSLQDRQECGNLGEVIEEMIGLRKEKSKPAAYEKCRHYCPRPRIKAIRCMTVVHADYQLSSWARFGSVERLSPSASCADTATLPHPVDSMDDPPSNNGDCIHVARSSETVYWKSSTEETCSISVGPGSTPISEMAGQVSSKAEINKSHTLAKRHTCGKTIIRKPQGGVRERCTKMRE